MAFNPHPEWGVMVCDACGEALEGPEDFDLIGSKDSLESDARERGWTTNGRLWNCSDCPMIGPLDG